MANSQIDVASVKTLAGMITHPDPETARSGKRELWRMARHVGRPGNDEQQQAMVRELLPLLAQDQPVAVRREAAWMVSELAGDEAVAPVAAMLNEPDLREDARMVLQRLPGNASLEALKAGLAAAPDDFKINIAESLRARGVEVPGLPDEKLKPTRQTSMTPVGR